MLIKYTTSYVLCRVRHILQWYQMLSWTERVRNQTFWSHFVWSCHIFMPVQSQNLDFHRNGCYVQWLEVRSLFVLFSLEKLLTITNSYFFHDSTRGGYIPCLMIWMPTFMASMGVLFHPYILTMSYLLWLINGEGVAVGVMGVSYGRWIYHYPYN